MATKSERITFMATPDFKERILEAQHKFSFDNSTEVITKCTDAVLRALEDNDTTIMRYILRKSGSG